MMTNELLREKYRVQKLLDEEADHDLAQYIANTHASTIETVTKYGLKLSYGKPGECVNVKLPDAPWAISWQNGQNLFLFCPLGGEKAMKPTVYIETSIPSYLTARRSRDLIVAANQALTQEWWDDRAQYDLYVSALVIEEAGAGNPTAAQKRLEQLAGIPELEITDAAEAFTEVLLEKVPLPANAKADALHIAIATLEGMDYLLTWNCAHIANAVLRPKLEAICREFGYEPPTICTPQELTRLE